jgi:hypothetical protein
MTRRGWITAASTFLVGLVVGAGGVQGYHRFHEKRTAEVFSRRLRCSELANQYARTESSDTQSVVVEMVGYSTVSNSCVAYFQIWEQIAPGHAVREWRVMNLLSGERLYTDSCREERDCGGGNDMRFYRKSKVAFDQAVDGQEVDVRKVE